MENILLWASLLLGLLVFVSAFLTRQEPVGTAEPPPDGPPLDPVLRNVALALPVVGLVVSLPTFAPFSSGQGLGFGFFLGGVASALAALPLLRGRRMGGGDLMAGPYGIAVTATAFAVLFLRSGLLDALMGVALGWFVVAFTLYLGLSASARIKCAVALVAGTGFAVALVAGAVIGALRAPVAASLSHMAWDAAFLAFAAAGVTLLYAASFLPRRATLGLPLAPLTVVALGGGVGAYLLADKVVVEPHFWQVALGGLLLCPVAALVLRDAARRIRFGDAGASAGGLPVLAILLAVSGFLVAFQVLQAFGASVFTLALFLAFPVTLATPNPEDAEGVEASEGLASGVASLLLFATGLLLYRVFVARYTGELRGVTLTDQYALFGLIVGAALPALLSSGPLRRHQAGASGLLTLAVSGALVLLAPAAVILLFGPKCALALLLGLALGAAQRFVGERNAAGVAPSFFPFLFVLAVALALCQWGGTLIPAVADLTRAAKVAWLSGLMAALAVLLFAADRVNAGADREARKGAAQ